MLSIFTDLAPQFPNVQTTIRIIEFFIKYVETTSTDSKAVPFAQRYLVQQKKSGYADASSVTMGFGLAFHLCTNERITKNHILDAINKNGRHRLVKMNDQHKAREHELSVLLQSYMTDLTTAMKGIEFEVVRTRGTENRSFNPFGSLVEISRTLDSNPPQSSAKTGNTPRLVDDVVNAWVQKCIKEFPDISIEKHLRSVLRERRIKIKKLDDFISTRSDMNTNSVNAFYNLLEQCRQDGQIPSADALINALLGV